MESLETTYNAASFGMLFILLVALLLSRVITDLERRLITSLALFFAGVFFLARALSEPSAALVGLAITVVGATMFVRAGLGWNRRRPSRVAPVAALFLLPTAFFGAVLLGGIMVGLLANPARAFAAWIGS